MKEQSNSKVRRFNVFSSSEEGVVQYPLFEMVFSPYTVFISNIRLFLNLGGVYALLISLLYILGGQDVYCNVEDFSYSGMCYGNAFSAIGIRVVVFILFAFFCNRYYQSVWQRKIFSLRTILKPQKSDLYTVLGMIVFIAINTIPVLSWQILALRIPNPDWRIELMFFGFVSIGFLVPVVALRFYVLFAYIWSSDTLPKYRELWHKTKGNMMGLILSVSIWFFMISLLMAFLSNSIIQGASNISYLGAFAGEYIFNFALLLVFGLLVNICAVPKTFLDKE